MVYVGTSGYSYKHWFGLFYPPRLSSQKMLPFYAEHFTAVEINYTFYRMPTEKTVKNWVARTPATFSFVVKCPRLITHIKKLVGVKDILNSFTNTVKLMEGKLKIILHQLSPFLKKDVGKLSSYLQVLPGGVDHVIEFRHNSWMDDEVFALLSDFSVACCIVSAPDIKCLPVSTASFVYIRMHGVTDWYSYNYKKEDLDWWVAKIEEFLHLGKDVYLFFNNDTNAYAVKNAAYMRDTLSERSTSN